MKHLIFAAILLLSFAAAANAQEPNAPRRRGLDTLDLLSLPSSGAATNGAPVYVNLQTFQLFEPLVRYCRELEQSYKTEVMDKPGPLSLANFDSVFRKRGTAIQRSIVLLRQMEDLSPQASALLGQVDDFGKDAAMVIITVQFPDEEDAKKEMARVRKKYNVFDATEPKAIVATILNQMNANFARLRVAE